MNEEQLKVLLADFVILARVKEMENAALREEIERLKKELEGRK